MDTLTPKDIEQLTEILSNYPTPEFKWTGGMRKCIGVEAAERGFKVKWVGNGMGIWWEDKIPLALLRVQGKGKMRTTTILIGALQRYSQRMAGELNEEEIKAMVETKMLPEDYDSRQDKQNMRDPVPTGNDGEHSGSVGSVDAVGADAEGCDCRAECTKCGKV